MKFTFSIITSDNSVDNHVEQTIDSIFKNNIPSESYEIIVIGGSGEWYDYEKHGGNVKWVAVDESLDENWYAKKKNMIVELAKFDNIVYSHDYLIYDDNWYNGFLKFGNEWDICMCIIKAQEGHRFRDWLAWDDPELCVFGNNIQYKDGMIWSGSDHEIALVPYDYNKTQYMQISGFWWVAKKHVMIKEPINKDLRWGEGEDVEWSMRVRKKYKYVMNTNSIVQILRPNKRLSAYYVEEDEKYTTPDWEKNIND